MNHFEKFLHKVIVQLLKLTFVLEIRPRDPGSRAVEALPVAPRLDHLVLRRPFFHSFCQISESFIEICRRVCRSVGFQEQIPSSFNTSNTTSNISANASTPVYRSAMSYTVSLNISLPKSSNRSQTAPTPVKTLELDAFPNGAFNYLRSMKRMAVAGYVCPAYNTR